MLFLCSTNNTNHQAETVVKILTTAVAQHNARAMSGRADSLVEMRLILRDAIDPFFGNAVEMRVEKNACAVEVYYRAVTGDDVILSVISIA